MERRTRSWLANTGLIAAMVLTTSASFTAQGNGMAQQAPPTATGLGPQNPGLSPLAVSQIEEGRRSDSMEQTMSLSFAEPIAIRELLLLLVRDTNLSVVPDPDVEGTFTGELKNVTLRQALELMLHPHGMDFTFHDNVLRVTRVQVETRIFNINYVATRRTGTRGTGTVGAMAGSTGQGAFGAGATGGFAAGGSSAGFGGGNFAGNGGVGGSQASVSGTDVGDVFEELQAGVQTLISDSGLSNMDRKAGLLQVTDFPDRLDKIALYLEVYENRVLRQVRIVAKIIEVELREDLSAGIDWPLVLRDAGTSVSLTQRLAPTRGSSAFTMGISIKDFKGFLNALASQGRVNLMASPWVNAMNNEPAVMRVGTQDVFFVTTSQVDATTGKTLQTVVTPQSVTEGLVLSVTPQITADGFIHMSIMPSITERTGTATSRLGDRVPIVSVREADTLVRVQEGETVIIAGLMQDRMTVEKTKVPKKRKTDLIILLTPTIMTPGEMAPSAAADQQRLYQEPRAPVRK
jgi:MSHA biogenesis protein MshL